MNHDDLLAAYQQSRTEAKSHTGDGHYTGKRGRPRQYDPVIADKRRREQATRQSIAYQRTLATFRVMYRDEYKAIVKMVRAEVAAERGPLPGDPDPEV